MSPGATQYWAVVPAAGVGRRMGAPRPKQYLPLAGQAMLAWTLDRLLAIRDIAAVCVVLAADDPYWPELGLNGHARLRRAVGGLERADSVLNGLKALRPEAAPSDWVLVHDAARPLIAAEDITRLMAACSQSGEGGLLAVPVRDTLKRQAGERRVAATVDRAGLWQAQTPQMFHLGLLQAALEAARQAGRPVTDEAQAMEALGHQPLLIEGNANNFKLTRPEDLLVAEGLLRRSTAVGHRPVTQEI